MKILLIVGAAYAVRWMFEMFSANPLNFFWILPILVVFSTCAVTAFFKMLFDLPER